MISSVADVSMSNPQKRMCPNQYLCALCLISIAYTPQFLLMVQYKLTHTNTVLQDALKTNFSEASVTVTDSPDLTQPPWHMASQGLCRLESVSAIVL